MEVFQYNALDYDGVAFRLVQLQAGTGVDVECEVIHASLDHDGIIPYEAASYTWGSSVRTDTLHLQGKKLSVTQNLYLLLRDLRLSNEDRVLWIDAICINQEDPVERGHQVRQMGDIYNRAERVLFCLGRPTHLTDIVMVALTELQKQCHGATWAPEDARWQETWKKVQAVLANQYYGLERKLSEGMAELLAQQWFHRIWILQEVANARAALVYCGNIYVPARYFVISPKLIGIIPAGHCQAVLDMIPLKPRTISPWNHGQDLYCLLRDLIGTEASDDRDKIYALLGMCRGGMGKGTVTVDYEKYIAEVIRDAVSFMCYCDITDLPERPFEKMEDFLIALDSLHEKILKHFVTSGQLGRVETILRERGQHIVVDQEVLAAAAANEERGKELMTLLLTLRGEDFRITTTVLEAAINNRSQKKELIAFLIEQGGEKVKCLVGLVEEGATKTDGSTPLQRAMLIGDVDTLRLLLEAGCNIEANDRFGCTPLISAAENRIESVVGLLLENDVDIEAINRYGKTPLKLAASKGYKTVVDLLIANGANVEGIGNTWRTPLTDAASKGHKDVVQLLLRVGANPEGTNPQISTPLNLAASGGHEAVVDLLLRGGADIEGRAAGNRKVFTPLLSAIQGGQTAVVKLLVERGANVEGTGGAFKHHSPLQQGMGI